MKTKQTQKPVSIFAIITVLIFLLAGGLTALAQQQIVTNEFSVGNDYVLNGIVGDTNWDGVYLHQGDLPYGAGFGSAVRGSGARTITANQNISYPPLQIGSPTSALQVNQSGGAWAGEQDNGFFIWKLATGDFDVSVRTLPNWTVAGNSFGGLMVRPWNTNNTGAPVNFSSAYQDENFLILFRDQEYGIDEIRQSSNGVAGTVINQEYTFSDLAGINSQTNYPFYGTNGMGTNSSGLATNIFGQTPGNSETVAGTSLCRWYRIVRSNSTNFTFYWSTNQPSDPTFTWLLITNASGNNVVGYNRTNGTITRPDWGSSVQFQVGICQAFYGTASGIQQFDAFSIKGTNLNIPTGPIPTPVTTVQVASSNPDGSVTLSWVPGTNLDGTAAPSLVMLRPNTNIIVTPISGNASLPFVESNITNADRDSAQYGASNNLVVFAGPGTGCTISGLGSLLVNYSVAVFSYTNAGAAGIMYNTGGVAPFVFPGPGQIASITAAIGPSSLPVGGAGVAIVSANYSTGGSSILSSATPGLTVVSDNPAAVGVLGSTLQGVSIGSANISVSLSTGSGTFNAPNVLVATHNPTYTDNFTTVHDYVAEGLTGSTWDGLYLNYGDNPTPNGTTGAGANGNGSTQVMGASTSTANFRTNALYISASASDWGGLVGGASSSPSDGPFLFKNVPGDFQAWVHITNMGTINTDCLGLMARYYNTTPGANAGGRFGPLATVLENAIHIWKQQNGAIHAFGVLRYTGAPGGGTWSPDNTIAGTGTVNTWLLLQRFQGTNFYFFVKSLVADPWNLIGSVTVDSSGAALPLEVGIAEQMITGSASTGSLDNFNLDATNIETSAGTDPAGTNSAPPAATGFSAVGNPNGTATFTWTSATNGTTPVASILVLRRDLPVNETPYFGEVLTPGPYTHAFGTAADNIGSSNYVVFRSADVPASILNSATISGLTAGHLYYAQVYTYDSTGSTILFNNTGATANLSILPGAASGLTAIIPSIPVGGLSKIQVLVQVGGAAPIDVTALATITTDPSIIKVFHGIATGLRVASSFVTNTYTVNGSTLTYVASVAVRPPTYVDNFSVNHDYLQNGTAGTIWDGVYTNGLEIPEPRTIGSTALGASCVLATNQYVDTFLIATNTNGAPVGLGAGTAVGTNTTTITLNNVLVVTNTGGGWEAASDDAFFLWKVVPGDFQVVVHLDNYNGSDAYTEEGIMARAFSDATNSADAVVPYGTNYAPFISPNTNAAGVFLPGTFATNAAGNKITSSEWWVSLNRFDQFGIGTYARQNRASAVTQNTQSGGPTGGINQFNSTSNNADGKSWLMIQRVNYTNFFLYARVNATDPWIVLPSGISYTIPQLNLVPMQVGIADMSFNSSTTVAWCKFDSFMLDASPTLITIVNNHNGTITLSWPAASGSAHLYSSTTVPGLFTIDNSVTITTANGISSATVPIGSGDKYYEVGP